SASEEADNLTLILPHALSRSSQTSAGISHETSRIPRYERRAIGTVAQGGGQELVPPAIPIRDGAPGNPERSSQGAARSRTHHDHTTRAAARRPETSQGSVTRWPPWKP